MSINRKYINKNKNKGENLMDTLNENYKRFLKEDETEEDFDSIPDEEETEDLDNDTSADNNDYDPLVDLDSSESEKVEDWVDELLQTTLSDDIDSNLDIEADADALGTEKTLRASDVPMTADDMETIIADDNSLDALEVELANVAKTDNEDDELEEAIKQLESEDELDEAIKLLESVDIEIRLDESINELENLIKESKKGSKRNTTPKKTIDIESNIEDVDDCFTVIKKSNFDNTIKNNDKAGLATVNDRSKKIVSESNEIAKLKFKNYKLNKINGLMLAIGSQLTENAKLLISEGINKCANKGQVEQLYKSVVEKVKSNNSEKSLKEKLNEGKKVNLLESYSKQEDKKITPEQMRKNFLMGLKTEKDMYNNF